MRYDSKFLAHEGNANSGRYPRGSGKNPYQHAEKIRKIQKGVLKDIDNIYEISRSSRASKIRKKIYKKNEVSKLTDQEILKKINRMNLERTYNSLLENKEISKKGEGIVNTVLRKVSSGLKLAGSVSALSLTMAIAYKEAKDSGLFLKRR